MKQPNGLEPAGELVFKAPINDQTDSQVMRGKFIDAMKQTGKTAPTELSYFEMPNMKVEYTYGVSNMVKPNFQINYGNGYPFTDAKEVWYVWRLQDSRYTVIPIL